MARRILIGLLRFYRAAISPLTPASCRYVPTCSEYAVEAIRRFGAGRGSWLTARRLLRCHPFGGRGPDPVPPADTGSRGAVGRSEGRGEEGSRRETEIS